MAKPNIQKSDPKKYEGPTVSNQPPVTIVPNEPKLVSVPKRKFPKR